MRLSRYFAVPALALLLASPAAAQQASGASPPAIVADLMTDVEQVRDKLMQLAEAIPESTWAWRPGEGVRSVREVFQHVAADNYLLAIPLGSAAPTATGIVVDDFSTAQAYEARDLAKADAIAEMQASFDHLMEAMAGVDEADLAGTVQIFGTDFTGQAFLVLTTTHLHEHLGQMIAYARTNGVVPPWSAGQGQD